MEVEKIPSFSIERFLFKALENFPEVDEGEKKEDTIKLYSQTLRKVKLSGEKTLHLLKKEDLVGLGIPLGHAAAIAEVALNWGKKEPLKRKRIEDSISDGSAFDKNLRKLNLQSFKPTSFVTVPVYPLLQQSKRTRFQIVDNVLPMMHRKVTEDLLHFIKLHHANKPAVYIHGPQGVGKSYSLCEVVCQLRSEKSNRVIYIPDCGGWGIGSGKEQLLILVEAICMSFTEDKEIIEMCYSIQFNKENITELLNYLPQYCSNHKLQLYAIFDQHNGLTLQQRQSFPFNIVERDLPSTRFWKSSLVVISASANNEYQLKVASDNEWPQFVINHGFSPEEFQVWADKNSFFKGQDLERIEYYTSRIPNELRMILESRDALPINATLDDVLVKYIETRAKVFRAQQELFDMNHLTTETLKKRGIHAVTLMLLGLDVFKEDYKMNQQLMFEEERKLYPITPLVKDLLESYWRLDLENELDVTFRTIFSSTEWTNDTKGRTLEKYIIRQIEKTKHFNVKTKKITAPNTWLQNQQFTFHNLTVFHFEGNMQPGSVDWSKSIIFVPDSCNYPDVDLLLWDPAINLLVPVQITILDPLSNHTNNFFTMRSSSTGNAAEAWKYNSKKNITINFLWIGTNDSVKFNKDFDQYVSVLLDLDQTQFPLLQHLKLNQNK